MLIKKIKQRVEKFKTENEGIIKEKELKGNLFKRWGRYITIPPTRWIYKNTNLRPNQLTVFVIIWGYLTAYLLTKGTYTYILIGAISLLLNNWADYIDGSLARMQKSSSKFGAWIDHVPDVFKFSLVIGTLTFGLFKTTNNIQIIIFGALAVTSYVMTNYIYIFFKHEFPYADEVIEETKGASLVMKNFFYDAPFIVWSLLLAAIFGRTYELIIFYGIYGWIYNIGAYFMLTRKILQHEKKSKIF